MVRGRSVRPDGTAGARMASNGCQCAASPTVISASCAHSTPFGQPRRCARPRPPTHRLLARRCERTDRTVTPHARRSGEHVDRRRGRSPLCRAAARPSHGRDRQLRGGRAPPTAAPHRVAGERAAFGLRSHARARTRATGSPSPSASRRYPTPTGSSSGRCIVGKQRRLFRRRARQSRAPTKPDTWAGANGEPWFVSYVRDAPAGLRKRLDAAAQRASRRSRRPGPLPSSRIRTGGDRPARRGGIRAVPPLRFASIRAPRSMSTKPTRGLGRSWNASRPT